MNDPVSEVSAIIENAADEVRAETLETVAAIETAAKLDAIEDKLEAIEEHTPETPISSPVPTTHDHPEIVGMIEKLQESIEKMGEATADVAETAADAVTDTAETVAQPVADIAPAVEHEAESIPKRGHFLFRKWFG